MKKILLVTGTIIFLMVAAGCHKKQGGAQSQDLGITNAPAKYGEVMGRALKKAESMDNVLYLKNKINTFHIQKGRYPANLQELVDEQLIDKIPEPPKGMKYDYDPSTGSLNVK
jgi:hypothetical protein